MQFRSFLADTILGGCSCLYPRLNSTQFVKPQIKFFISDVIVSIKMKEKNIL